MCVCVYERERERERERESLSCGYTFTMSGYLTFKTLHKVNKVSVPCVWDSVTRCKCLGRYDGQYILQFGVPLLIDMMANIFCNSEIPAFPPCMSGVGERARELEVEGGEDRDTSQIPEGTWGEARGKHGVREVGRDKRVL
jgi:hypothetical protein